MSCSFFKTDIVTKEFFQQNFWIRIFPNMTCKRVCIFQHILQIILTSHLSTSPEMLQPCSPPCVALWGQSWAPFMYCLSCDGILKAFISFPACKIFLSLGFQTKIRFFFEQKHECHYAFWLILLRIPNSSTPTLMWLAFQGLVSWEMSLEMIIEKQVQHEVGWTALFCTLLPWKFLQHLRDFWTLGSPTVKTFVLR